MINKCGIYKITNKENGKAYIGLARNIEKRWNQHRNLQSNSTDKNLYWAFKEFGLENFEFEIIKECEPSKLGYWERKYIKEYDTYHNGYNSTFGGEGSTTDYLKDKYDINYEYNVLDQLNYESYQIEEKRYEKYLLKCNKINNKIEIKTIKLTEKNKLKKLEKIQKKLSKKHLKFAKKRDSWDSLKNKIIEDNKNKYQLKIGPINELLSLSLSELEEYNTMESLQELWMTALKIKRFQSNYIKYKKISLEACRGDLVFRNSRIIYKLNGFKNMETNLEDLKNIFIHCYDNKYIIDINDSRMQFCYFDGVTLKSNVEIYYPTGNTITFYSFEDFKYFINTFKKIIGI